MGARIQAIQHPRYSHMVVAVDPARREKSGRAHRHTYYFTSLREAQKKLKEIGGVIDAVGVQGLTWTPEAKRDAFEARALLDAADFANLPLAEVVARWLRTQGAGPASRQLVTPLLDACLDAKSRREGLSQSARDNIEVRVGAWLDREIIVTLGDITRERCLALADREGVAASTRKNDMNAVSSFLTWLVQEAYLPSHPLQGMKQDELLLKLRDCGLHNYREDRVKVVYHPDFIATTSPLFGMDYSQFVRGCHLGIFPSYYEPWGYTPMECVASGVPTITSDLTGFGDFVMKEVEGYDQNGIMLVQRTRRSFEDAAEDLAEQMFQFCQQSRRERIMQRNRVERMSEQFDWRTLIRYYQRAYAMAVA